MRFHSYLFFDTRDQFNLTGKKLDAARKTFAALIKKNKKVKVEAYGTLAMKSGTRFMLHANAATLDEIQLLVRDLLHTELGKRLKLSYTLLGQTKASQYNPKKAPAESAPGAEHRYLVVYPFTKTTEWHLLPYEQRRAIMMDHVDVGRKYSKKIAQLLLYSYGIDDHEFIVSYQMDDLDAFQDLVMEMRGTESRRYTKNDLPIFTCIHMPLEEALEMI